jgi:DNA-directed RNA polymerase subunit RPC12/RpoP
MPYCHTCSKDLILVDPDDEIEIAAVLSLRFACKSCSKSYLVHLKSPDMRSIRSYLPVAGVGTWGTFATYLTTQHWTKCFCSFLPGADAAVRRTEHSRLHCMLLWRVLTIVVKMGAAC